MSCPSKFLIDLDEKSILIRAIAARKDCSADDRATSCDDGFRTQVCERAGARCGRPRIVIGENRAQQRVLSTHRFDGIRRGHNVRYGNGLALTKAFIAAEEKRA